MKSKSDQNSSGGMKRAISGTRHGAGSAKRAVARVSASPAFAARTTHGIAGTLGRIVQDEG